MWEPKRFVIVQITGGSGTYYCTGYRNAAGQIIPPTIIFDTKNLKNAWTKGELLYQVLHTVAVIRDG